jgi:hypothetical protein
VIGLRVKNESGLYDHVAYSNQDATIQWSENESFTRIILLSALFVSRIYQIIVKYRQLP